MQRAAVIIALGLIASFYVPAVAAGTPHPTLIHAAPSRADVPAERWYVTIPGGDEDRLLDIFHDLRSRGASRMQCFLPDVMVCDVPVDVDPATVSRGPGVVAVRAENVDRLAGYTLSVKPVAIERGRAAREEERRRYRDMPRPVASPDAPLRFQSESRPIPVEAMRASARSAGAVAEPDYRLIHQDSEILAGTILIQAVLPESDYPETIPYYQNWSEDDMDQVALGFYYAVLYYQDEFPNANINVIYRWRRQVPIKAEPIGYPSTQDDYWIALTLAALGYAGTENDVLENAHEFNEDARIRAGADWVFTALVANAAKIEDHMFWETRALAWEYVGGPYFVTCYPSGYLEGAEGFGRIAQHEMGHIFWGVDEDDVGSTTCNTYSGYMNVQNLNKVTEYGLYGSRHGCDPGPVPIPCVMNELDQYVLNYYGAPCTYSQQMFGVSDLNENTVPDALDLPPAIEFEAADVETVTVAPEEMHVHVRTVAVRNRNPIQPRELRRDYASPIRDISVRVGGVPPYTIEPRQIGSDGYEADFDVALPQLLPGPIEIVVDARNEFNAVSPTRVKRYVYVHLKYVTFNIHHPNEGIRIDWEMLGDTFDAAFELIRTGVDTGREVVVAEDFAPSGPRANGLTPYSVLDRTAVIGEKYTYRVRGTIDLPHRGSALHKVVESISIPAQGAVPRTHTPESPVSNAAPNPFSSKTWISVTIPFVDTPAPGIAQSSNVEADEPSTFVRIEIYDVLGRRVGELFRRWVIGSAVTVSWDGTDQNGAPLPSGMYFIRSDVGTVSEVRKVMLVR